jgi:hypothetical protein
MADQASQTIDALSEKEGRTAGRLDLVSAVVLGVSALATTYASYQAELWDGEQAALYTEANALRVEASKASLRAGQLQGADLMSFGAYLSAFASNEEALEQFYVQRFRPEFLRVFNTWIASEPLRNPDAAPTPFALPDYDLKERRLAADMERQAHEKFAAREAANDKGDRFVLATVILANALFFGGINQLPHSLLIRKILLGLAVAFCAFGVAHIATLEPAP